MRHVLRFAVLAIFLGLTYPRSAHAWQTSPPELPSEPPPNGPDTTTASTTAPTIAATPVDTDAPALRPDEASRDHGLRLALEAGVARAVDSEGTQLNGGSPTLLPLGVDISFRTSRTFMVGAHGYAALASRSDCISVDSCRARAYGFGAHVEGMVARGRAWVVWLRYGIGGEILYQGGLPLDPAGHQVRDAFDFFDMRVGADFTLHRRDEGKSIRVGPYLGLVAGMLVGQSGITTATSFGQPRNLDDASGSGHAWFTAGLRATLDP
jgi:hypothetical protein